MSMIKEKIKEVVDSQPDDATYEDILRELAFEKMINRGLGDVVQNRTISNNEMKERIDSWVK